MANVVEGFPRTGGHFMRNSLARCGYFLSGWLERFAYRIDFPVWVLIAAAGTAVALTLLTVSYQDIRTALTNPGRHGASIPEKKEW